MKSPKFIVWVAGIALFLAALTIQAQTRILPLGDSITSSITPQSSYRYWLWHSFVNGGYNVDFVGSQFGVADGPPGNDDFDQNHEGHPGWTTEDALESIDGIMDAYQPDVVLLNLGSNDIADGVRIPQVKANLKLLIERIHADNENTKIFVAMPTPYKGQFSARIEFLGDAIIELVKREQRAGIPAVCVNLFDGFSVKKQTVDGTHPNVSGEKFIANKFYNKVIKVLPR